MLNPTGVTVPGKSSGSTSVAAANGSSVGETADDSAGDGLGDSLGESPAGEPVSDSVGEGSVGVGEAGSGTVVSVVSAAPVDEVAGATAFALPEMGAAQDVASATPAAVVIRRPASERIVSFRAARRPIMAHGTAEP
jgi:hypothetical protein